MNLSEIRNEYMLKTLDETEVDLDPIVQFKTWLDEALNSKLYEPAAMALATVGSDENPSVRIVLLKQIHKEGFVFFTNYLSRKGRELSENPKTSAVIYWSELQRQVRIEGVAEKTSDELSDSYFQSRPEGSRISALISPQSQVIPDREFLEEKVLHFTAAGSSIVRPSHWGGYIIKPFRVEFWQGRENRLHDRILYTLKETSWKIERLAP